MIRNKSNKCWTFLFLLFWVFLCFCLFVVHFIRHSFQFLDRESWWEGLLQLLSLFTVGDHQSVQVAGAPVGAANLHSNILLVFLDLHGLGILSPCGEEEVLHLFDLLRHSVVLQSCCTWWSDKQQWWVLGSFFCALRHVDILTPYPQT